MSDIFISYARKDLDRAKKLAEALEAQGWSVFWDRTIRPGKNWRKVIVTALREAGCVIVAWSHTSIESDYVLELVRTQKFCEKIKLRLLSWK